MTRVCVRVSHVCSCSCRAVVFTRRRRTGVETLSRSALNFACLRVCCDGDNYSNNHSRIFCVPLILWMCIRGFSNGRAN